MSLSESYRCARSLEAIENYARADSPLIENLEEYPLLDERGEDIYMGDEQFWDLVLGDKPPIWGHRFRFDIVALSEWVPRVPGLFWSKNAAALRNLGASLVEYRSNQWTTFKPLGKSQIVMGGVGSLKFPPDETGHRLVSFSLGHNASSGIPALIAPEVWEHHDLKEGDVVKIHAQWQKMSIGWAERFPSIRGIPRGYLTLTDPSQVIRKRASGAPIETHPCTVMQYSKGETALFDFVYATADTSYPEYRQRIERFFANYKNQRERYGRYLLSADINDPLWEAEYDNPAALRRSEPGAEAHLALLEARVYENSFKGTTLEDILRVLVNYGDHVSLQRLSDNVGIPWRGWFRDGTINDSASQLLAACMERKKIDELLDALVRDNPQILM
jgi:hypothetical protein